MNQKRPKWFKFPLVLKATVDSVSDEEAGRAIKNALAYFDTGEIPEMDKAVMIVFSGIRAFIDEAISDYAERVQRGKDSQFK